MKRIRVVLGATLRFALALAYDLSLVVVWADYMHASQRVSYGKPALTLDEVARLAFSEQWRIAILPSLLLVVALCVGMVLPYRLYRRFNIERAIRLTLYGSRSFRDNLLPDYSPWSAIFALNMTGVMCTALHWLSVQWTIVSSVVVGVAFVVLCAMAGVALLAALLCAVWYAQRRDLADEKILIEVRQVTSGGKSSTTKVEPVYRLLRLAPHFYDPY